MTYVNRLDSKCFFYTDKQKEILGRIFKYHRKNDGITPWDYIRENNICAYDTYSKIEKGIVKTSYDFYDGLLKLYCLEFVSNPQLEQWLPEFITQLYQACILMDKAMIAELEAEMNRIMPPFTEYVIYHEYSMALKLVFIYYSDDEYLDDSKIIEAMNLLDIFSDETKILLLEVIAISNTNFVMDYELEKKIETLLVANQDNPIIGFYHALSLAKRLQGARALKIHRYLVDYWNKKGVKYRSCKSLMGELMIYRNLDKEQAQKTITTLLDEMKDFQTNTSFINSVHYNIGVFYYTIGEFTKAMKHFQLVLESDIDYSTLFMLCLCSSHTNNSLPTVLDECIFDDSALSCYLEYFAKKRSGVDISVLEDFLVSNILVHLKNERYLYPIWQFFEHEVFAIAKITRNYSKHRKYLTEMEKNGIMFR